jgi:hypothetical protein
MSEPSEMEGNEVCVVDDDPSVLKSIHYLLASEDSRRRSPRAGGGDRHLDGSGDRLGSARPSLRSFTENSCNCHYGARRPGSPRHRHGHRPGRLFHETVRRRKIHHRGSRRSQSKQEIILLFGTTLVPVKSICRSAAKGGEPDCYSSVTKSP